jgi:hypothetical protein
MCIPVVILLGKLRLRPFTFYLKLRPQIVKAKNNFNRILLLASDEKGKKKGGEKVITAGRLSGSGPSLN